MKFTRFELLIAITFFLAFSQAQAISVFHAKQTSTCAPTDSLKNQSIELFVPGCIATCTKVLRNQPDSVKNNFEKSCHAFAARQNRNFSVPELGQEIMNDLDQGLLKCLPMAAGKAVIGTYEMIKALPEIVGYLLSAADSSHASEAWRQCAKSPMCKRALATNTLQYSKISDDDLEKLNLNDLMTQVQHDLPMIKTECSQFLATARKKIFTPGIDDWTTEKDQQVYDDLASNHSICPGALQLASPRLFAVKKDHTTESVRTIEKTPDYASKTECLRRNPNPTDCLTYLEQISFGSICIGEDFDVDFCADVVSVLVPLPLIGPQTSIFKAPAAAKAATTNLLITEKATAAALPSSVNQELVHLSPHLSSSAVIKSQQNFILKYSEVVYIKEEQNLKYIALAENSSKTAAENKTRFFDIENSAMKTLNDSTGNKNLVTSLTNFQKESFLNGLKSLQEKYPNLKFELYSDFKSIKIGIHGDNELSPAVNTQFLENLNKVYLKSNQEFVAEMNRLKISVPQAGDPKDWFKAGYGRSVDEAALAARRSRDLDGEKVLDFSSEEVRGAMTQKISALEEQRKKIAGSEKFSPFLEKTSGDSVIPQQEMFDLVRKNKGNAQDLAQSITKRYPNSKLTVDDATLIQKYVKGVDEFSPTLLIGKRENINFDTAVRGGASADFLGMGSANLHATAEGLAQKSSLESALAGARIGEKKVTEAFKSKMDAFKKTVGGEVVCSGDDCIRIAKQALSEHEKTKMLAKLAQNSETRNVRMSFIGENVPAESRMQLASHGESIEKAFRKELEGKVSNDKLSRMTFGFEMETATLNQGNVNLIVGKAKDLKLNPAEKAELQFELQAAFARALEKQNANISNYTQGSARTMEQGFKFVPGPGALQLLPINNDN